MSSILDEPQTSALTDSEAESMELCERLCDLDDTQLLEAIEELDREPTDEGEAPPAS
jgi:hypothetical protein